MDRRLACQVIRSSGYFIPFESEEVIESHSGWFSNRRPSVEGGLNSLPYLRAVPPSAFRAASRSYWCPRMMRSAASGDMSNLNLQCSGSGCCQFATRLTASLSALVGGLGLRYVVFGVWFVMVTYSCFCSLFLSIWFSRLGAVWLLRIVFVDRSLGPRSKGRLGTK
jgi:hypothetical protein